MGKKKSLILRFKFSSLSFTVSHFDHKYTLYHTTSGKEKQDRVQTPKFHSSNFQTDFVKRMHWLLDLEKLKAALLHSSLPENIFPFSVDLYHVKLRNIHFAKQLLSLGECVLALHAKIRNPKKCVSFPQNSHLYKKFTSVPVDKLCIAENT